MKNTKSPFLATALLFSATFSQAGNLLGVVSEEGEALSDVEVMLIDASNVVISRYYTDRSGSYRFYVTPGTYKLGATKEAYLPQWVKDISITGQDMEIAIELTPTAFAEEEGLDSASDCD